MYRDGRLTWIRNRCLVIIILPLIPFDRNLLLGDIQINFHFEKLREVSRHVTDRHGNMGFRGDVGYHSAKPGKSGDYMH